MSRGSGDDQLTRLAKKTGLSPTPLREYLAAEPEKLRKREVWEPRANCVYLPSFATARVYARLEDLSSAHHGYFRLPLNPNKALAEYVAAYLGSPLGREV